MKKLVSIAQKSKLVLIQRPLIRFCKAFLVVALKEN